MNKPTPQEIESAKEVLKAAGFYTHRIFHITDVIAKAKQLGHELSEEQAHEVFDNISCSFMSENGISWDVIEEAIEFIFE